MARTTHTSLNRLGFGLLLQVAGLGTLLLQLSDLVQMVCLLPSWMGLSPSLQSGLEALRAWRGGAGRLG